MKKSLKKSLAVVLCMAMMFTVLNVISFAADGDVAPIDPGTPGFQTLVNVVKGLIANVDWASVLAMLKTTFQTIMNLFSGLTASTT
jgi:hypothetical protein